MAAIATSPGAVRRRGLSDAEWARLRPLLPDRARTGRPPKDHRPILDALLWLARTGVPWRDLPERYGPWQTVYERLTRWRRDEVFNWILDRLRLKLNAEGLIDLDLWCIDSTSVRASRSAAGARKTGIRRSRTTMRSASPGAGSAARSTW